MQITGDWWAIQPRGWPGVLRCVLGLHRSAMEGTDGGEIVDRCKCGAIRLGGRGSWVLAEDRFRRVSPAESARLIAAHQERMRLIAEMWWLA